MKDEKTYLKLELNNEDQLDLLIQYYCLIPKNSLLHHLRFGQFIYNLTDIEYKNSYNEPDEVKVYNLLTTYISESKRIF